MHVQKDVAAKVAVARARAARVTADRGKLRHVWSLTGKRFMQALQQQRAALGLELSSVPVEGATEMEEVDLVVASSQGKSNSQGETVG